MIVDFFVPGVPAPKGSMRAIPFRAGARLRVAVKHDNGRTKPWVAVVAAAGRKAMRLRMQVDEPVAVNLCFVLPRPKNSRRDYPAVKPDLDKLVRCVLDALTGVVWTDDGRVVRIETRKIYARPPTWEPGVWIEVDDTAACSLGVL